MCKFYIKWNHVNGEQSIYLESAQKIKLQKAWEQQNRTSSSWNLISFLRKKLRTKKFVNIFILTVNNLNKKTQTWLQFVRCINNIIHAAAEQYLKKCVCKLLRPRAGQQSRLSWSYSIFTGKVFFLQPQRSEWVNVIRMKNWFLFSHSFFLLFIFLSLSARIFLG